MILTLLLVVGIWGNPLNPKLSFGDERIIGGTNAPVGGYPYQSSLRTPRNIHYCGGSVISNRWILTAAHCVYGKYPSFIRVVVGTNQLNSGGTVYEVSRVIWHQAYNQNNSASDVALLLVFGSIQYNSRVQPIELSKVNPGPGAQCILSGWGITFFPSEILPNNLQHISLKSMSVRQCMSALKGYPIFNSHVCTYVRPGQGACQGDSGGPLVSGGVQVGIVSWGIPCAKGRPDVFTSVAYFRNWIYSVSGV